MPFKRHLWLVLALCVPWSADAVSLHTVVHRWSKTNGIFGLARDRRLDRVARANSEALAEIAGPAPSGASAYLRFLLAKEGVHDAVVHGVVRRVASDDATATLRRVLEERRRHFEFNHFGVAASRGLLTLILVRRLARVRVRAGKDRLRVCVRLPRRSPVRGPQVLVTQPAGGHFERAIRGRRGCVTTRAEEQGRYQVEVMVEGRFGPEVAALFPVYIGVAPPRLPVHRLYPDEHRERGHVEIKLMRLLNRSRRTARLGGLSPSGALASVARSHSQDMLVTGFFGHISPRRGDLARRLARSGLAYQHAGENLAVTMRPERAHESLMASPSHRRTILDPHATHVGVGVATDPSSGLLYVTEIIARLRQPQ